MRLLTATAFLVMSAWATGAADDPKDAAKKLEGTYEVLAVTSAGLPDMKDTFKAAVIKDGKIIFKAKTDDSATFTLDPSKKPSHIDIAPDSDEIVMGIYEVKETDKGTELTIALGGPKTGRPKDFKGEGKGEVVFKLLRKKAK